MRYKKLPNLKEWEITRFWSRCQVKNECLEWSGSVSNSGYGVFHKFKYFYTHRMSYKLCNKDPSNNHICHTCDNPKCVNPNHLFLGDDKANLSDMSNKGRNRKTDNTHVNATLTAQQVQQIRTSDDSNEYWAEKFEVTSSCISLARSGVTYTHVGGDTKGSPRNKPKLSESQVRVIRLSTRPVRELSRVFSVDRQTINKIQDGKSYKQFPWTKKEQQTKHHRSPGNTRSQFGPKEIAWAAESSLTHAAIATKYGVSRGLVSLRLKEYREQNK